MTGKKKSLSMLEEKNSPQKVSLGYDYQYPIKGIGESSDKLEFGTSMKMKEVLYVPSLKKNLLSISSLDKKGYRVSFIDGQVLMWTKGKTLEDAVVIGEEEGGLYKLKGQPKTFLVHAITSSSELWHSRISHIKYKALLYVRKVVIGLPYFNIDHEGTCKGCARGKNIKNPFLKSETMTKGTVGLIHSDVCGPMPSTFLRG